MCRGRRSQYEDPLAEAKRQQDEAQDRNRLQDESLSRLEDHLRRVKQERDEAQGKLKGCFVLPPYPYHLETRETHTEWEALLRSAAQDYCVMSGQATSPLFALANAIAAGPPTRQPW